MMPTFVTLHFLPITPPLLACAAGQSSLDTARILFQYGACSTTAVPGAVTRRRLDMLKLLLDNGVDFNDSSGSISPDNTTRKFTALHIAAYSGYEDVAEILLSKGADKETICLSGKRPVDVAVEKGHQDVASRLSE